jgi:hypothetical protein
MGAMGSVRTEATLHAAAVSQAETNKAKQLSKEEIATAQKPTVETIKAKQVW